MVEFFLIFCDLDLHSRSKGFELLVSVCHQLNCSSPLLLLPVLLLQQCDCCCCSKLSILTEQYNHNGAGCVFFFFQKLTWSVVCCEFFVCEMYNNFHNCTGCFVFKR